MKLKKHGWVDNWSKGKYWYVEFTMKKGELVIAFYPQEWRISKFIFTIKPGIKYHFGPLVWHRTY